MDTSSIGKLPPSGEFTFASGRKSDFTRAKTQYYKYVQQIKQSGSFNFPVTLEAERDMLDELKKLAKKERLSAENDWISAREKEIDSLLTNFKVQDLSNIYYLPSGSKFAEADEKKRESVIIDLINSCRLPDGSIDPSGELILNSFKDKNQSPSHIKKLIEMCKFPDESFSPQMANIVKNLNEFDVAASHQIDFLEEFTSYNIESADFDIDNYAFSTIPKLTHLKLSSAPVIDIVKFLKRDFENQDTIISYISKLYNAEISVDSILDILNEFSVKDVSTQKFDIDSNSVNSILSIKKSLVKYRDNEVNERTSPISKIGVDVINFSDDDYIIMKDGKVVYSKPVEGENPLVVKENYNKMIFELENNFLTDFTKNYVREDGTLDSNALRLFSALRKNGIVYNQLIPLINYCIDNGEINHDKLSIISLIKATGALSSDLIPLINSIPSSDGVYDENVIDDICDLSLSVIAGKDVISLLPFVRDDAETKLFISESSSFFKDKNNLVSLAEMLKEDNSSINPDYLKIASLLKNNFELNYQVSDKESKYLDYLSDVMNIVKKNDSNSELSHLLISSLTENDYSYEEILNALRTTLDIDSNIDKKLALLILELANGKTSFDDINATIISCKNPDLSINYEKVDSLLSMLNSGSYNDEFMD